MRLLVVSVATCADFEIKSVHVLIRADYAQLLIFCGFVEKNTKFSFNNPIQFIGERLTAVWKSLKFIPKV